ncbi:GIY-YIG nuclease family protein [Clostridium vitabionis]|jgi:putative endonuclease|uniref:GIY-YIG nuclease family protein n=1 Tax=Clostridium vitabionis TaxID=2784388 RepID=UPI00188BA75B|nr:GIY-YIG nuclease family protein [Clostridium vitabionis]
MNYTYLLRCADGTYYCGWTNDLEHRLKSHNSGKGARYTRSRRPVALVWYEEHETRGEAMSREAAVKRLSRGEKEKLVSSFREEGQSREGKHTA